MPGKQVIIDWVGVHHPGDGIRQIESELAAGLDEGPLLVVSRDGGWGPRRPDTYLFETVADYIAHLLEYGDELKDDRWVGLVRSSSREEQPIALAALSLIRGMIAPPKKHQVSLRPARKQWKVFDYATLSGTYETSEEYKIVSIGDAAADFARDFPKLAHVLGLDDDDDDNDDDEWS